MPKVLIQAGHSPSSGGAPGEAQWTTMLAQRLAGRLRDAGVRTVMVGDWFHRQPPPEVFQDYDLFVSLHYDAAIYGHGRNSGCFADRAANDPVGARSDMAIAEWEKVYPAATTIPLVNARRNPNTRDYYAFRATTARTPGIIVEHGCGAPVGTSGFPPGDDASVLHDQLDRVADLDAQAILKYLERLTGDDLTPAPNGGTDEEEDEVARLTDDERAILEIMKGLNANSASIIDWVNQIGALQEANRQLQQAMAAAGGPRAAQATITYADGTTQQLVPSNS